MGRRRQNFFLDCDSGGAGCGRARAALLLAGLLAASGGRAGAAADSPTAAGLKQLTVEELMNVEVTSVAKEPQKLLQAAAAIEVITADEIRRSGATTLPEVLRLADNLEVAQINAHDWAISARGFNANLANKLLVLIDGRAIYTPLYGGVLWNVQDLLLRDIDRIEVISGPGGTLWGANAVNGVINIVTKAAAETQGLYAYAGGGNEVRSQAGARYGATLAPGVYLRAWGKYTDEGSQITDAGTNPDDGWHMARGGFRLDADASSADHLTLQGGAYNGSEHAGSAGEAGLSGGNVLGRWTHTAPSGSSLSLLAYYDHTYLAQPFAASPANPPFFTGFPAAPLMDDLETYDLELEHHFAWGARHKLAWGLGYRATHESDHDLSVVRFSPPVLAQSLYSAFLQDEILLVRDLYLTVGSKLEHNDYTGFELEPSTRLQWNLAPTQLVWAAVSRAVRTPSRYDRDLIVPSGLVNPPPPFQFPTNFLQGNPGFESETLTAWEAGWRASLTPRLAVSLSTFYNDYRNLRSTTSTPTTATYVFPYPVYFQNNLEGDTYGIELSSSYQLRDWWRLHAGYDLLREHIHVRPGSTDATGATNETADPQQQFQLRSRMDLPHAVSLDAALRWIDTLWINNGPTGGPVVGTVPRYFGLDARLAWQLAQGLELAVAGRNLLHDRHAEYTFPAPTREQIERSVFGSLTWSP